MAITTSKILIVFKTHLDLGFTGFAKDILNCYLTQHIPAALSLARETRDTPYRFRWSIGSWMLEQYRRSLHDSAAFDDAVKHGDIRYHALPFTTHTEYMDGSLFDYGLSVFKKLDARYGMTTIAAKMTDVPGHTIAMVPHLSRAGVKFLHIGVNPASTVPDVPPIFYWQAETGERVLVMYNGDYGQMTPIGGSGVSVYFAHTGDNCGVQSAAQIKAVYDKLHAQYPEAELVAATLEDVAQAALAADGFPTCTCEIGDSWIHGTGTDPAKTSAFRALSREAASLNAQAREALYENLLPVPEHTWGLDEKTHITGTYHEDFRYSETRFFVRSEFESARKSAPFRQMEASWDEQRDYIRHAAKAAGLPLPETSRPMTDTTGWTPAAPSQTLTFGAFTVTLGENGVSRLARGDAALFDEAHPFARFRYELFSQGEYDRFRREYVTSSEDWAIDDFGKRGVSAANDHYRVYDAVFLDAYRLDDALLLRGSAPKQAHERFGAPARVELLIVFEEKRITVDCAWFQKPASRVPEAIWLAFCPNAALRRIHKLDAWIDPFSVVSGGNRRMHVTQKGIRWDGLQAEGLDTGLVSLGAPSLLEFDRTLPESNAGAWFNLYNNVWGTNFPMWYDENARFRFVLTF